jgi:hypothetical protein
MISHFAVKISEENTPDIVTFVKNFGLNVTDDLNGIVAFWESFDLGTPYAILEIDRKHGRKDIAKCYVVTGVDFDENWELTDLNYGLFHHVVRKGRP